MVGDTGGRNPTLRVGCEPWLDFVSPTKKIPSGFLVGDTGVEPVTSSTSKTHSSQLS